MGVYGSVTDACYCTRMHTDAREAQEPFLGLHLILGPHLILGANLILGAHHVPLCRYFF